MHIIYNQYFKGTAQLIHFKDNLIKNDNNKINKLGF